MNYDSIKFYFEAGKWSLPMVKNAVRKGVITKEEYTEITGEKYE